MRRKKMGADIPAKREPEALFYVNFSNRKPALVSVPERVLVKRGLAPILAGIRAVYFKEGMYVSSIVKFDPDKQTY